MDGQTINNNIKGITSPRHSICTENSHIWVKDISGPTNHPQVNNIWKHTHTYIQSSQLAKATKTNINTSSNTNSTTNTNINTSFEPTNINIRSTNNMHIHYTTIDIKLAVPARSNGKLCAFLSCITSIPRSARLRISAQLGTTLPLASAIE